MPNLLALQKYSLGDSDFYYKNKDRQNIEEYGGDKSFFVMVYEPFEKYGIQFGGWKIEFHFERTFLLCEIWIWHFSYIKNLI